MTNEAIFHRRVSILASVRAAPFGARKAALDLPCNARRRSIVRTARVCSDATYSCRKRLVIFHVWRNLSPAA